MSSPAAKKRRCRRRFYKNPRAFMSEDEVKKHFADIMIKIALDVKLPLHVLKGTNL